VATGPLVVAAATGLAGAAAVVASRVIHWRVVGTIVLYARGGATAVVGDVMRDGVVRATAATADAHTVSTVVPRGH